MPSLNDVLGTRGEEVMLRWRALVQGRLLPESMPIVELVDHLPLFLRQVSEALRAAAGVEPSRPSPGESRTAADHGVQRLRLGFSLDSVVREYGALRDAIFAVAHDAGLTISPSESQSIFNSTINGIAHAVSEYVRQRDAELHRQHNEHVAFIAHELRNPLASVTMAVEVLKTTGVVSAEMRPIGALANGLKRMQDLIDHSLQTARVASGVELRRERIQLKALLEEAELVAALEAEAGKVSLHVRIEEDADLHIDVRLVRSALSNLVRNAVKYSCAGGAVELRGKVVADRLIIEVEDTCGGLEEGKIEAAFAPFVRMNNEVTGFGLGIAIAKQAVDAHAGTIRVQNLPGKGCIFVLELPTHIN